MAQAETLGFSEQTYPYGATLEDAITEESIQSELHTDVEGLFFTVLWTTPFRSTEAYSLLKDFFGSRSRLGIRDDILRIPEDSTEIERLLPSAPAFDLGRTKEADTRLGASWFHWHRGGKFNRLSAVISGIAIPEDIHRILDITATPQLKPNAKTLANRTLELALATLPQI